MIVTFLKKHEDCPELTPGQHYSVIGIEADYFRILNDRGNPCLYEPGLFEISDPREPSDWISETGEDGERYAYPPSLNHMGFFEDFFDGKKEAVTAFWQAVNHRLTIEVQAV
jgi:hypothetical protein